MMKKENTLRKQFSLLMFAVLMGLAACGGGGDSDDDDSAETPAEPTTPPETPARPDGVYMGTVSNGNRHYTIVLDDNQFYTVYGSGSAYDALYIDGFWHGHGNVNGNAFTSSDVRDYFWTGEVFPASLDATFVLGASFSGSAIHSGATVPITFTGEVMPTAQYDYDAPASLSEITGTWSLTSVHGDSVLATIASTGTFTATSEGCAISGDVHPRASGKNVFDVSLSFGPAPCLLPGQSARGIALSYLLPNGQRELLIGGTSTDRAQGTAMYGIR
jgi:hypothetical protein